MNSLSLEDQIKELLESTRISLSNFKPSEWHEKNRVLTTDVSPFPGPYSYKYSPYLREVVDCASPDHPARIIAFQKGAQLGISTGVIEAAIGYIIAENPGNIMLLTGHAELTDEAMNLKVDQMIQSSGLSDLIRPNVTKKNNVRSGDTVKMKEFPGGSLVAGAAGNHKLLRQRSIRFGFVDDFDAAKGSTKESGSTRFMIEQRFAAYGDKMKLFYISTPELEQSSNIAAVYAKGDQRKYKVPCPHCGEFISLEWSVPLKGNEKERAGITWKTDDAGKLIEGSVGYICQNCGKFFDDRNKYQMNLAGRWEPTAEPSEIGYYSYHLNALYAPPGMYNWEYYVREYISIHPPGREPKEKELQSFTNLCLGLPYKEKGEAPKANDLQRNTRKYDPGTIPETLSIKDGNGHIIALTCACDLNGIVEDARLDWEIVAWSETGASYSVNHGSIGTFIPREGTKKNKEDRERWTYDHGKKNSVWPEFIRTVVGATYVTDTKRRMPVILTGVDTGHYTTQAYAFVDKYAQSHNVIALKGKDVGRYVKMGIDLPKFKIGKERVNLYLVEVGLVKDDMAYSMKLRWDEGNDAQQPSGFMNYPQPAGEKYTYNNFYSHYESEARKVEYKDGQPFSFIWEKKSSTHQNHFWDVRCYNIAVRDIFLYLISKSMDQTRSITWEEYAALIRSGMNDKS